MSSESQQKLKVGIVGFGHLGQFLFEKISTDPAISERLEISFVWNRTIEKIRSYTGPTAVPDAKILDCLDNFCDFECDIIAEVSHPDICKAYGAKMVSFANLFIGSPTSLSDPLFEQNLREAARKSSYGVYIPSGALWGADDIAKMADLGSLKKLVITMKKHPSSLKVLPPLDQKVKDYVSGVENIIYQGPVRELCPLAPNNVNTMACAALAAHNLGFDGTEAILIADDRLSAHVITIKVTGPETPGYGAFEVNTERVNPAPAGAVTGQQTFLSFLASLLKANGRGNGFHFC